MKVTDFSQMRQRWRMRVRGIVQGVGFRPFVFTLASRYGLTGHVGNDNAGVFIEVEGPVDLLEHFRQQLIDEAPALAHIETVTVEVVALQYDDNFQILESHADSTVSTHVPPDVSICDNCLQELLNPKDRRYRYPFINCTHCGPRFTIIQRIPYDRANTTMAAFEMCPACAAEYHDPHSRRFHAQPIACPECGPILEYRGAGFIASTTGERALDAAQASLRAGQIVAVKGLGGFHLACDATNNTAVATLRERKGRVDKPFAVMVRNLAQARQIAWVDDAEAELLASPQRPIVLLRKRPDSSLSNLIAPGNPYIGLMLPYTPLHHLLLEDTPLVMTSGNHAGEPIAFENDEAQERLGSLADAFLLHNRSIQIPCDDSVFRVNKGQPIPIRRSRGYTPLAVKLPFATSASRQQQRLPTETSIRTVVLATGAELKNTFCLTHQGDALLSQHIGDMENLETLTAFERAQAHFCDFYHIRPQAIVCDLHPNYLTTRWAETYAQKQGVPLLRVQHHHAHIASVMAEHELDGNQPVIGLCFDGTGYGTDGTIWGGEVLVADYASFKRVAYLKPVPLLGGDLAIKHPYRMALAYLWSCHFPWDEDLPPVIACPPNERGMLARQLASGFQRIPTTSAGRLFDAVASLIGLRHTVTYEAQAAIELEGIASEGASNAYTFHIQTVHPGTKWVPLSSTAPETALMIDPGQVLASIISDLRTGVSSGIIAARFHDGLANVLVSVCQRLQAFGYGSRVALSGGVFQNVRLLSTLKQRLQEVGFTVFDHKLVPTNDAGLALGQAVIGAQHFSRLS
ncbi:MAG: carbamoyltransferase HypF [Anaerolineae bacterium]|nr:carbamoyltransferase HypF [Anaerolineae bacterium]